MTIPYHSPPPTLRQSPAQPPPPRRRLRRMVQARNRRLDLRLYRRLDHQPPHRMTRPLPRNPRWLPRSKRHHQRQSHPQTPCHLDHRPRHPRTPHRPRPRSRPHQPQQNRLPPPKPPDRPSRNQPQQSPGKTPGRNRPHHPQTLPRRTRQHDLPCPRLRVCRHTISRIIHRTTYRSIPDE